VTALLQLDGVEVRYGAVAAVRDLSIEVHAGEIVGLIGPNGAGKSSTLHAIMGLVPAGRGAIMLRGAVLARKSPEAVARLGIALVPEGRRIFAQLTVDENLRLGLAGRRSRAGADDDIEAVRELFPIVREFGSRQAGVLSGGQQQQLAIARALVAKPDLLLLDEPSLGLAPKIVLDVYAAVAKIAERGLSILFVEQNVRAALLVAHRGYVLANGRIVAAGTSAELERDVHVREAFLGRAAPAPATTIGRGS
jgi:branched-chain amino acid transport system ATP-binding protein